MCALFCLAIEKYAKDEGADRNKKVVAQGCLNAIRGGAGETRATPSTGKLFDSI